MIDSGEEEVRIGQKEIKFNSIADKIGAAGAKNAIYFAVALAEEGETLDAGEVASDNDDDSEISSSDESDHERRFSFTAAAGGGNVPQNNTAHNVPATSARGA